MATLLVILGIALTAAGGYGVVAAWRPEPAARPMPTAPPKNWWLVGGNASLAAVGIVLLVLGVLG